LLAALYLGVAIGYIFLTVLCLYLLLNSKWDELVADAASRSEVTHTDPAKPVIVVDGDVSEQVA
jgi:hypothetical protein